jgi:hypothetical protein
MVAIIHLQPILYPQWLFNKLKPLLQKTKYKPKPS